MKKVVMMLVILFSFSFAQVLLDETFSSTLPVGWEIKDINTGNSSAWAFFTYGSSPSASPYDGSHLARFYCYGISAGKRANLITKVMDFTTLSDTATFSFYMYHTSGYSTKNDSLIVMLWPDTTIGTRTDNVGKIRLFAIKRYSVNAGWTKYTTKLGAAVGKSAVRIIFQGYSDYGENFYIDKVVVEKPQNMQYVSSTALSPTYSYTYKGDKKLLVLGAKITTQFSLNPLQLNELKFALTGTTNQNDVENLKVFYTGKNANFIDTMQIGSTITNPVIGDNTFTTNLTLQSGDNYFWLVTDVKSTATLNNKIDAEFTSLKIGTTPYTPATQSVAGDITIYGYSVYKEAFNDSLPSSWTKTGNMITAVKSSNYPPALPYSQGYMLKFDSYTANAGTVNLLSSPLVDLSARTSNDPAYVRFKIYRSDKKYGRYVKVFINNTKDTTNATLLGYVYGYKPTNAWYDTLLTIPASFNGTENYIIFKFVADWQANIYMDDIEITQYSTPMQYASSTVEQITGITTPGEQNAPIVRLNVVMNGAANPKYIKKITFSLNGTTNINDIEGATIYYTGNSSTFSTTKKFGNTITALSTNDITVHDSINFLPGNNYFWLAYNIKATATVNNFVDGEIKSFDVSGTNTTPSVTAPAGNKKILGLTITKEGFNDATLPTTWSVITGSAYLSTKSSGTFPSATPYEGTRFLSFNAYNISYADRALIASPQVDLTNRQTDDPAYVKFAIFKSTWPDYRTLRVFISEGKDTTSNATLLGEEVGYSATNQWNLINYNIPAQYKGKKYYILFKFTTLKANNDNIYVDAVEYTQYLAQAKIDTVIAIQNDGKILPPMTKVQLMNFNVKVSGTGTAFNLTSVKIKPTGTTNFNGIENLRLFYTGNSSKYLDTMQVGNTVATIADQDYNFDKNITLKLGDNYFWLAVDVKATAQSGDIIDAELKSITVNANVLTNFNGNPPQKLTIVTPLAGTYTIDPNGTGVKNYKKFSDAVKDLNTLGISDAVTFNVKAGSVFVDSIEITTSGTQTKPIKFVKDGTGANPIIKRAGTTATNDAIVKLVGAKYIEFNGIDLEATTNKVEYGLALTAKDTIGSGFNTFKNMNIKMFNNLKTYGVYSFSNTKDTLNSNRNNTFQNVNVNGAFIGYYFVGLSNLLPDKNNKIIGVDAKLQIQNIGSAYALSTNFAYGIYLKNQQNVTISNVDIKGDTLSSSRILGIYADDNSINSGIIEKCKITNLISSSNQNYEYWGGIYIYNGNFTIRNNVISGLVGKANNDNMRVSGIYLFGGNCNVYNNMISNITAENYGKGNGTASVTGIYVHSGTHNLYYNSVRIANNSKNVNNISGAMFANNTATTKAINNIFVNAAKGTYSRAAVVVTNSALFNFASGSDYNNYYIDTTDAKNFILHYGTNGVKGIKSYKNWATGGVDKNSKSFIPKFKTVVEATYDDLHLNLTQKDDDYIGTPIAGITTDIDGDTRNATLPYIGADELQIALSNEVADMLPKTYELYQNYPNPFNPSTVIRFALPVESKVILKVYNILGQEVATLVDGEMVAGYHKVVFNANNLSSGVYFYRLDANKFSKTMKFMLVK